MSCWLFAYFISDGSTQTMHTADLNYGNDILKATTINSAFIKLSGPIFHTRVEFK